MKEIMTALLAMGLIASTNQDCNKNTQIAKLSVSIRSNLLTI